MFSTFISMAVFCAAGSTDKPSPRQSNPSARLLAAAPCHFKTLIVRAIMLLAASTRCFPAPHGQGRYAGLSVGWFSDSLCSVTWIIAVTQLGNLGLISPVWELGSP
jgi:hypothetical protein